MRPWVLHWGATPDEVEQELPGDEIVPHPSGQSTRAIDITAPVEQVWPWLAQMGQDRGGLYSYDWLENLAGLEFRSTDRIVPEWQAVEVGDITHARLIQRFRFGAGPRLLGRSSTRRSSRSRTS